MNIKKTLTNIVRVGIGSLALYVVLQIPPTPGRPFTPEFIKAHDYVPYDLDKDGSIDALGYKNASTFTWAKPSVKDNRVWGFTKELTPDKLKMATDYFSTNKKPLRS